MSVSEPRPRAVGEAVASKALSERGAAVDVLRTVGRNITVLGNGIDNLIIAPECQSSQVQ